MAHPSASWFEMFNFDPSKKVRASLYKFAKAGDELPMHSHEDHGHSIFVVEGSVELFDDAGNVRVLHTHDNVPQITPGKMHGLRAREDNSKTLHISIPGAR